MKYKTKEEMFDRITKSRSWNELGFSIKDLAEKIAESNTESSVTEAKEDTRDAYITELEAKVSRLMDTNKQLRAENKTLKSKVKNL